MIRGPYINIASSKIDDLPKNKSNDMPNVNSKEFRERFADILLDQGDLLIGDAYQEGAKIQYDVPYFEAVKRKENIEVTCYSGSNRCSYIKRRDLLPYFNTVSCGRISRTDYVIVDGHCFPSLVHAFLSMFTIDDNHITPKRFIPKPWRPYHSVISMIDDHVLSSSSSSSNSNDTVVCRDVDEVALLKQQVETLTSELSQVKDLVKQLLSHIVSEQEQEQEQESFP